MELWQEALKSAITSVKQLEGYAFLAAHSADLGAVENSYRTLVPEYYLSLIDKNDPEDPIAKMAFPQKEELSSAGLRDPIGDLAKQAAPRLTHRYGDRALLHVTNLCPMYCRFCFRKNLMNEREEELYAGDFLPAMHYLRAHPEVVELIFTGGDPWIFNDHKLSELVDLVVKEAPAIKVLRFHTRMPVTLPLRITSGLLRAIQRPDLQTIVVTHFNHPRELSSDALLGAETLRKAGVTVLNQTVLLKGVNDTKEILHKLFRGLGQMGVLPYYLHHCDLVQGGAHFRTSIEAGQALWQRLRGELPGYLLPEYVLDLPGGLGKIPLVSGFVEKIADGEYKLRRAGKEILYKD